MGLTEADHVLDIDDVVADIMAKRRVVGAHIIGRRPQRRMRE
jgi:hypothetical protein